MNYSMRYYKYSFFGEWVIGAIEGEVELGFYQAFTYQYNASNCNSALGRRGTIKFGAKNLHTSSKAFTCLIKIDKNIHTSSLMG